MNKVVRAFVTVIGVVSMAHTSVALSLTEATKIYRGNFKDSPPSVQESGEYLFVIVEDDESKSADGSLNELILSAQLEAIESYIGGHGAKTVSPFSEDVTKQLLPLVVFKIPEARRFPVERKRNGVRFRDVTAFELAPIKAAKEKANSGVPMKKTFDEWASLLKERFSSLRNSEERTRFLDALGATTPLLASKGGVSCIGDGVDYVLMEAALQKWNASKQGVKDAEELLKTVPSCSIAWKVLSEADAKDGDLLCALVKALRANAANDDQRDLVAAAIAALAEKGNAEAWKEYGRLFGETSSKAEVLRSRTPVLQYALRTCGRMRANTIMRNDAGSFKEAQGLFDRGENLPRILDLLAESLSVNPGDSLAWRYYGASLRTAGKMHDAVIAYHQALLLNHDDEIAAVDLCISYQKLGMRHLAEGNAWYLVATSENAEVAAKAGKVILGYHQGDFGR